MSREQRTELAPVGAAPYALTSASLAFEPRTTSDALALAATLCASGLMPKGASRPEAAFFVIATGRELGLTALQSLRSIHVVDGKPTMSADLMIALCKRSPQCERFALAESTSERATYATTRHGEGETRMTFTREDAERAGLAAKDVWRKYPAAMLRARCASALARAVYPDVLLSVYDSDSDELDAQSYAVESAPRSPAPAYVIRPEPLRAEPRAEPSAMPAQPVGLTEILAIAAECADADTLDRFAREVGRRIPAGHPDRESVRAAFAVRRAELASGAAVATVAPAREPGSDDE